MSTPGFLTDPRRACVGVDTDLFFPADNERGASKAQRIDEARRICARCPFRRDCARYALDKPERWGIWGGLTETRRQVILRRRRAQASSGLAVAA